MKKTVLLIVGHTGAGKSFLTDALRREYGLPAVRLHDLGRALVGAGPVSKRKTERRMLERIEAAAETADLTVVDGLSCVRVYRALARRYRTAVCYLDTPYGQRIARVAEREGLSVEEAAALEREKERGKRRSGLERIIARRAITVGPYEADAPERIGKWITEYEKEG